MELPKAYNPGDFENKIYKGWEKKRLFNPDTLKRKNKPAFSIVLPPPNVTAILHLGSAAMLSIEDVMVRYKRMRGFDTVWIPGSDHAAIATQNVVEKKLLQEQKLSRHDLGREKFLVEVDKYVESVKGNIHNQMRRLGASLDWSREAYTMDETRSRAVLKVFKMMHDDGLIYRGKRIVNWCPRCKSTLADDEVEYNKEKTKLYTFKYSADFPIAISTTRPETKLGDTAVAVNPQDYRYKKYVGQEYNVKFCGISLKIKVIADRGVDRAFGTGALGVTPSHSKIDWELAEKNNLEKVQVINEYGCVVAGLGAFSGQKAGQARESVVQALRKKGLMLKEEDMDHDISVCYRCGTPIEPLPSLQWFVDVNKKTEKLKNEKTKKPMSLKEMSIEVVKSGKIKIIPERFEKTYFHWMENLHDWCISRQIWFGHRIPVWYKKKNAKSKMQKNTEILGMRHGQAFGNKLNKLNSDIKNKTNVLTVEGRLEVEAAIKKLKAEGVKHIYSSDFPRAKQTADMIGRSLKLRVTFDKRLREVGVGEFEGKSDNKLQAFREDFSKWHFDSPKGVESFFSLKKRVYSFLDEITEKSAGKKALVVSHGDVLRLIPSYGEELTDEEIIQLPFPKTGEFVKSELARREEIRVSEKPVKEAGWVQDEDTLDTWFSSGTWTFSTLLKKDFKDFSKKNNPDLNRFHPTTILETGYDIVFFWVARMILMTTYATGEVPFKTVYLHGLIRDKEGDKMSKSKPETAIDPVEAGDKYGMDAVRLSLLIGNTAGNDLKLYDEKIAGFRNLVNKIWNISRFILINSKSETLNSKQIQNPKFKAQNLSLADRWILSRFNCLKKDVTDLLDKYNFSQAGELLREFTWSEFADWYLEVSKTLNPKSEILNKSKIQNSNSQINSNLEFRISDLRQPILLNILRELLALWHPFAPFVTQAVWNELSPKEELMIAEWPAVEKQFIDKKAEKDFETIKDIIIKIRNLRSEYKVEPGKRVNVSLKTESQKKLIQDNAKIIETLARTNEIHFLNAKPENSAQALSDKIEIYLSVADLVDSDKEKERLNKEKDNLENYVKGLEGKLANAGFVSNAPASVVEGEKAKLVEAKEKLEKVKEQLNNLK